MKISNNNDLLLQYLSFFDVCRDGNWLTIYKFWDLDKVLSPKFHSNSLGFLTWQSCRNHVDFSLLLYCDKYTKLPTELLC